MNSSGILTIYRFMFILMLIFLLGGCVGVDDPCTQHVGSYGSEPYYYYTGDCGEGVTAADTKQTNVPYIIQFDNSFLNYNRLRDPHLRQGAPEVPGGAEKSDLTDDGRVPDRQGRGDRHG